MAKITKQEIYDLKNQRKEAKDALREMLKKDGVTDAYTAKKADYEALDAKVKEMEALYEEGEEDPVPPVGKTFGGDQETPYQKAVKALAEAARKKFDVEKDVTPGSMANTQVDADGAYMVPQDIVTRVFELRDAEESLLSEVRIETATAQTGRRTIRKRSQYVGFATVEEAEDYPLLGTPQFETISYLIQKRGGITAATAEIYNYTDGQIATEIEKWLAGEARATGNRLVLEAIKTKEATALGDLDGILKAWVGLGSAFRATSKLITNDDGLAWLGTLKDGNGQYLLKTNVTEPSQLQLSVGPYVLPVKVYSNNTLPSEGTTVPMILGDLSEAIVYWQYKAFAVKMSDTAVVGTLNAYRQNLILWRGDLWDDCTLWDSESFVYGTIDTAAAG